MGQFLAEMSGFCEWMLNPRHDRSPTRRREASASAHFEREDAFAAIEMPKRFVG
jgi:hypothetical protein